MKTNIKAKAFSLAAAVIGVYLLASPAYATCGVNGLAEKPSQRKARLAAEAEDAPTKNVRPSQTVRCPAGSAWDGKGCWAKNLKAVSR